MSQRVSSTILMTIIVAAAAVNAESPRCSATARECDKQIRHHLSGKRYHGMFVEERNPGLVIKAVTEQSPAWIAGLKPGDRLIAMNDKSLTQASGREFKQIIADARESGRLRLIIWRRGAYSRVEFRLEPYTKEQIEKIISAHLAQSHPSTLGAQ